MAKLFVSYAREDQVIVQAIVRELQDLGLDVWFDRYVIAGSLWGDVIAQEITNCDCFLLFASANSVKSDGVRREVDIAHKNDKKIIPVRLEKVDIPTKWDYQLAGIQWIEYLESDWKSRLLLGLGALATASNLSPTELYTPTDQAEQQVKGDLQRNNDSAPSSNLELTQLIEIFDRDFVNPNECDEVSASLKNMATTLSLKHQYLYLEFSFKKKILALADQIDEFRKICAMGTLQADGERRNVLNNMEELLQELNDTQNV